MAKKIGIGIGIMLVIACFVFFGFIILVTMSIPDYKYICGGGYNCRLGFIACENAPKEEQYNCFKALSAEHNYVLQFADDPNSKNNFDKQLRCTKYSYLVNKAF